MFFFDGQVTTSSATKCTSCDHTSEEVLEPFTRIVVPVWENHTDLRDGLNSWAAPDVIEESRLGRSFIIELNLSRCRHASNSNACFLI